MLLGGLFAAGLLVGALLARWWAIALPGAVAAGVLVVSQVIGLSLRDSPLAFVALATTIAVWIGVLWRRRVDRRDTYSGKALR